MARPTRRHQDDVVWQFFIFVCLIRDIEISLVFEFHEKKLIIAPYRSINTSRTPFFHTLPHEITFKNLKY